MKKSLELVRAEPGLIVSGNSAKDLIRDLCALSTYEATAGTATKVALAIGGDSQRAMGTDEFTTATSRFGSLHFQLSLLLDHGLHNL